MTTKINHIKKSISVEEVIENLKKHMEEKGIQQTVVAKAIGASPSMISLFLKKSYGGDIEGLKNKIVDYLNLETLKSQSSKMTIAFAETTQARGVWACCNFSHIHKKMGLVHGPAGTGKTMALREYAQGNTQVIMVTAYAGVVPMTLMSKILRKLKLTPKGLGPNLMEMIIAEITGSDKLLIVDEAQHLRLNVFEMLRHINDMARVGVVFAGNESVVERMTGKENTLYDQIFSRIAFCLELKPPALEDDIKNILNAYEIKYDRSIVKFLKKKASKKGHYRWVENLIRVALETANFKDRELTLDDLEAGSRMTFGYGG